LHRINKLKINALYYLRKCENHFANVATFFVKLKLYASFILSFIIKMSVLELN